MNKECVLSNELEKRTKEPTRERNLKPHFS